jgi:hypothetical protein
MVFFATVKAGILLQGCAMRKTDNSASPNKVDRQDHKPAAKVVAGGLLVQGLHGSHLLTIANNEKLGGQG